MKVGKYKNKRVVVDGVIWASQGEYARWIDLKRLEQANAIRGLERQIRVVIEGKHGPMLTATGRKRMMVLDYRYFEGNRAVYEDFKGMETADWEFKADAFLNQFPGVELRVVKKDPRKSYYRIGGKDPRRHPLYQPVSTRGR